MLRQLYGGPRRRNYCANALGEGAGFYSREKLASGCVVYQMLFAFGQLIYQVLHVDLVQTTYDEDS